MRKLETAQKQQDTMHNYFAALLRDDEPVAKVAEQPLNRLLDKVTAFQQQAEAPAPEVSVETDVDVAVEVEQAVDIETATAVEVAPSEPEPEAAAPADDDLPYDDQFQALYFEVAGLKLAVRLEELGGIHRLDQDQINVIPGKPAWFKGLVAHHDKQLRVIDSGLWVMPEKYSKSLADSADYQYLIMLKDSPWGLACHKLDSTRTISVDGVRWRQTAGKRPWLKGMVIDEMCALLNVDQMIELFDNGLGS